MMKLVEVNKTLKGYNLIVTSINELERNGIKRKKLFEKMF